MINTRMENSRPVLLWGLLLMLIHLSSCQEAWTEHFSEQEETINMKLIDALANDSRYSHFMELMTSYGFDSILINDDPKTLFIPSNEAFNMLEPEDTIGFLDQIIAYHMSPTIFLSNNLTGSRQILSVLGKYIEIQQLSGGILMDSVPVVFSSPLYLDGKYYELSKVAIPDPSIYNYMERFSPFMAKYIDSFDSIYMDRSLSLPIGYNSEGETIYDSVFIEYNVFEEEYFPISEEFRSRTATMLMFTQEQFDAAIEEMALNMGVTVPDIPEIWQYEVLMPHIIKQSVFEGSVEYYEFRPELKNILEDTSFIDPSIIDPDSRYQCSNGLVYNYLDFEVPAELYLLQRKFEAEEYLIAQGLGRYVWKSDLVTYSSSIATEPEPQVSSLASNDTSVVITLKQNFSGTYSLELTLENIFEGDYILEWRANYRPSGNFKVFVNDVDVTGTAPLAVGGSFDLFLMRDLVYSVERGKVFVPDALGYNSVDFKVEDIITEYGDVKVRIEYVDSGSQSGNGLSIDYLALTPIQK